MRELTQDELTNVAGGIVPLVIGVIGGITGAYSLGYQLGTILAKTSRY